MTTLVDREPGDLSEEGVRGKPQDNFGRADPYENFPGRGDDNFRGGREG